MTRKDPIFPGAAEPNHPPTVEENNQSVQIADEPQAQPWSWFDWFCLWYPPGWLILLNRHWQRYHDDPDGWNYLEYALFLIPFGFYIAFLLRWLRLGCRAPRSTSAAIDPTYQTALRRDILAPILKHYFQAELYQPQHLPNQTPFIATMNHAGMAFPWDFLGLGVLLSQEKGWLVRPVAHELFFDHPWLRWWLPAGWSQSLGGVRAERQSFESTVSAQEPNLVLLYAPEGWRGLAKGWRQRHQLQTFDPSFVRLSDRHHMPIMPVACIGNEYLHPWTVNVKRLARWSGLPLFPLSFLMLAFLLFPSMGVWANRTRLRYYIQPVETVWQTSGLTQPLQTRSVAYQKAQELRSRLQHSLNQHLVHLGFGSPQAKQ
ncbi:1-acyl-sn-glycerol-3-phosphate acyltransferase [Oculatella sp. LEGE 06141]|uniref:1-acyl-sn-glycerol-3-phosphate acyltransferase n=1 Tax=Oculatella sp. LEGE 06141 TaxID=1828648 RepID=UPI001881A3F2|nr:1-acyl-sn-glycerol-3-phosphate acyltransferase [Oculatella sp. LEGE 06141]MBE9177463.1 1-acyl-sn-glycerol-3-phosphate acyltransferase [Oculatella sp. LEGE 06141]